MELFFLLENVKADKNEKLAFSKNLKKASYNQQEQEKELSKWLNDNTGYKIKISQSFPFEYSLGNNEDLVFKSYKHGLLNEVAKYSVQVLGNLSLTNSNQTQNYDYPICDLNRCSSFPICPAELDKIPKTNVYRYMAMVNRLMGTGFYNCPLSFIAIAAQQSGFSYE